MNKEQTFRCVKRLQLWVISARDERFHVTNNRAFGYDDRARAYQLHWLREHAGIIFRRLPAGTVEQSRGQAESYRSPVEAGCAYLLLLQAALSL